ncbi:MAG: DUF2461 family protein [Clostridia bacterium]|nr:DUF2461 family protein [Clostridia bacterium]
MNQFNGFPKELPDFWFDLHFNNNVENEAGMKEKYKTYIINPLSDLYETLVPTVLAISENTELVPARCISSPYTDRRFSRGTPFKEYMYLRFKQKGKKTDIPGFYFDMGAEYYSYGLRVYKQTASGLSQMKEHLSHYEETVSAVLDEVLANGYEIIGEDYKKDHFPDVKNDTVKMFLNKKTFYIGKNVGVNASIYTKALADEIAECFWQMSDIFRILADEK